MGKQIKTEYTRYYYTDERLFEQSLDVYKPVSVGENDNDKKKLPLVVLVVGSAWLGHRSIIYTGTSWWNSSGPKAFAQQGCVTVCIRHRGSFPRIHGPLLLPVVSLVVALIAAMYMFPNHDETTLWMMSIAAIVISWLLLALGARGAASFEDMVEDVAEALTWVEQHKDSDVLKLLTNNSSCSPITSFMEEKKDGSERQEEDTPLLFGGYSSGGHVAATLLQRPDLFSKKQLPAPHEFCNAAIFISGVLAVRPPIPFTTTDTTTDTSYSTWCTDLVTNVVFGSSGAAKLPSPLHGIHKQPQVPHLLIGCEKEVFGLGWMDVFFCSRAFCDSLTKRKIPAKIVEVQSDHWNILGSTALRNALTKELEWIMTKALE